VLLVSQPIGLVLAIGTAVIAGGAPLPGGDAVLAAAGGATGALGLGAFYLAMSQGAVSIVAPIASMGVAVPVAGGLLKGDDPGPLQVAGLVLALVGIALAAREAEHPGAVSVPARSVVLAAFAGLGFGTFFLTIDSAAAHNAAWATVAARGGGVLLIVVAAAASRHAVVFTRASLPALAAIGALDILANDLFAFATRHGLLSLVSVSASLYPVATVLLARFVLGERLARIQQIGVAIAMAGVALIAAGV
jgi:drug/metabolite transporter (DMT)-like permease